MAAPGQNVFDPFVRSVPLPSETKQAQNARPESRRMEKWNICGKRVLITGATDGIGLAAAAALAGMGAKLAIVARDESKARRAVTLVKAVAGNRTTVDLFFADLTCLADVRRLAAEVLCRCSRLHVLINNAGAMYGTRQLSKEGIELPWALNHLAAFLLTTMLLTRLKQSAPARIITTSSDAHHFCREIRFDDPSAARSYWGFFRYGETKLANILFTKELTRRLRGTRVTANCFHPGLVATAFNRNNGWFQSSLMTFIRPFSRSPQKGAETMVWLATSPDVAGHSGEYFVDMTPQVPSAAALDPDMARRLWDRSTAQVEATARTMSLRPRSRREMSASASARRHLPL